MEWNLATIIFWSVLLLGPLLVVMAIYLVALVVHFFIKRHRRRLERAAARDGRTARPVVTRVRPGTPHGQRAPRDE